MNKICWKGRAFKALSFGKGKSKAGRNFSGSITIFHRGGGSKKLLRRIDFQRKNEARGVIERIEYDPNRTARIALVRWSSLKFTPTGGYVPKVRPPQGPLPVQGRRGTPLAAGNAVPWGGPLASSFFEDGGHSGRTAHRQERSVVLQPCAGRRKIDVALPPTGGQTIKRIVETNKLASTRQDFVGSATIYFQSFVSPLGGPYALALKEVEPRLNSSALLRRPIRAVFSQIEPSGHGRKQGPFRPRPAEGGTALLPLYRQGALLLSALTPTGHLSLTSMSPPKDQKPITSSLRAIKRPKSKPGYVDVAPLRGAPSRAPLLPGGLGLDNSSLGAQDSTSPAVNNIGVSYILACNDFQPGDEVLNIPAILTPSNKPQRRARLSASPEGGPYPPLYRQGERGPVRGHFCRAGDEGLATKRPAPCSLNPNPPQPAEVERKNTQIGGEARRSSLRTVISPVEQGIASGISLPLWLAPLGSVIHNIELYPGEGGKLVRAAGASAQLVQKPRPTLTPSSSKQREANQIIAMCTIRLPSGQQQLLDLRCRATIGVVSNTDHSARTKSKAGQTRWLGFRPVVRGVAMNPIDHPHGGGEGRTKGGRPSVSPWGKPTKGHRSKGRKGRQ